MDDLSEAGMRWLHKQIRSRDPATSRGAMAVVALIGDLMAAELDAEAAEDEDFVGHGTGPGGTR